MEATLLKALNENKSKLTLLAVTHKPTVMNICGRVILLDQGKIVWDGKLNDYKALVAKKMSKRRKKILMFNYINQIMIGLLLTVLAAGYFWARKHSWILLPEERGV